jgi:hypothetical protein
MLSVANKHFMQSVLLLNVIMLSVSMPNAILSTVNPDKYTSGFCFQSFSSLV